MQIACHVTGMFTSALSRKAHCDCTIGGLNMEVCENFTNAEHNFTWNDRVNSDALHLLIHPCPCAQKHGGCAKRSCRAVHVGIYHLVYLLTCCLYKVYNWECVSRFCLVKIEKGFGCTRWDQCAIYAPIDGIPGAWWGKRGELTYPNGTSPHTWGTILRTIPLHIPYKYPISPCCAQCVTGRYGYL